MTSGGWQRYQFQPLAPAFARDAAREATRMMNDPAHGIEDQKSQPRRSFFMIDKSFRRIGGLAVAMPEGGRRRVGPGVGLEEILKFN
jgi:hypothetical protein